MWKLGLICLWATCVWGSGSSPNIPPTGGAWHEGKVYHYHLEGRTLSALHQLAPQYTGILLRGKVDVFKKSESVLGFMIVKADYADVNHNLTAGWETHIDERYLSYQSLNLDNEKVDVNFKNGAVSSIIVNAKLKEFEVNILKGVISLIQLDLKGENGVKMWKSQIPMGRNTVGFFNSMEDTVSGKCLTLYNISPLQKYMVQSNPQWVPLPKVNGENSEFVQITKAKNYSQCDNLPRYNFGFARENNYEPASSHMGNLLSRSSLSKISISADSMEKYTVQSSVTYEKIIISPQMYNAGYGSVNTCMNLTLAAVSDSVSKTEHLLQSVSNPKKYSNLVYDYLPASSNPETRTTQHKYNKIEKDENSSSSSASSSSEEVNQKKNNNMNKKNQSGGSSSSSSSSSSEEYMTTKSKKYQQGNSQENRNENNEYQHQNKKREEMRLAPRRSRRSVDSRERGQNWNENNNSDNKWNNQGMKQDSQNKYEGRNEYSQKWNNNDSSESSSASSSENRENPSSSSSSSSSSESSQSSMSLSSSEEDWQSQANIDQAPFMPFSPHFIAYKGNSVQAASESNVVSAVEKLSVQISEEIHNIKSLAQQNSLSKYVLLSNLVQTMNLKQMKEVAQRLYSDWKNFDFKNQENSKTLVAWEIYKHSLGTAGTGSALETIKYLIEEHKVGGERAAEIISRFPKTAVMPNKEFLELFFSIVKSPVVEKQKSLNSTAVLAFAELLRMSRVSNGTAYMYYPLHTYGPVAPKHDQNMYEKYLPFFEQNLNKALSNNDGHKAQIYIMALGRTAHPRILSAFEEHLEGKKQTSQYHRFLMVKNLYYLAKDYPRLAHPVLIKLYQNYAEEESVRVEAVQIILRTYPSAETLQMLAMSTNTEPSRHVKSTIISAIESAASDYPHINQNFVRNAESARYFLKPKDYRQTLSKDYFFSLQADDVDVTYENNFGYIGSKDHNIPKVGFLSTQGNTGGISKGESYFSAMTSTVNELLKKFSEQFVKTSPRSKDYDNSKYEKSENIKNYWNAEKIAKYLGVKIPSAPEVEATLMFGLFGSQRVAAFDNSSIESIPRMIKEMSNEINQKPEFEFTTIYNDEDVQLGFPTPMGLPFLYRYARPVLAHVSGEAKVNTHPDISSVGNDNFVVIPHHVNISFDVEAVYAIHTDTKFGFVAPFNHHEYFTGVSKNIELNAGFKSEIAVDTETYELEINVKPTNNNRKRVVFEYRTTPYTTNYDLLEFKPALEQRRTEGIHVAQPVKANYQFGQKTTGMVFQYFSETERIDDDDYWFDWSIFNFNRMQTLPFPWIKRGNHPHVHRLVFDPSQSSTDSVKFNFAFQYKYNPTSSSSQSSDSSSPNFQNAIPSSHEGDYRKRQQEYLQRVSAGIPESDSYLVDFSAAFEQSGQTFNRIKASAAFASSDVSPISNALFYYGMNPRSSSKSGESYEVCAATKSYFPRVPQINMNDAMKSNPNSTFHANVAFGRDCNSGYHFDAQALLSQSQEYSERMEVNRMKSLCNYQMEKGNALSDVCQNATQSANQLDHIKVYMNFNWDSNEKSESAREDTSRLNHYKQESLLFAPISVWLNKMNVNYVYKNKRSQNNPLPRHKVEISTWFSENLDYVNVTVLHGDEETRFTRAYFDNQLRIRPFYIAHWFMNSIRFSQEDYMNLPSCSLSKNYVNTFDNTTYQLNLGNEWYSAFLYTPKRINPSRYLNDRDNEVFYDNEDQNVAIISKEYNNGKAVKMILGDYVVELKPAGERNERSISNQYNEAGANRNPSAHVYINGHQETITSDHSVNVHTNNGEVVAKVFAKPNGEVTVKSNKYGLTVRYYGQDVDIYAAGYYKDNVRGLCGTYDDDKYNDFTSPRNCVLRDSQLFAASYALSEGDSSSHQVKQLQSEAANAPCYKDTFIYANVISDVEAGRSNPYSKNRRMTNKKSKNAVGSKNYSGKSYSSSSTDNQRKYIEYPEDNKVCFSIHPIPKCRSGYQSTRTIEKEEPFFCMEKRENAEFWMKEIDAGRKLDFTQQKSNQQIKVKVPESCQ